MKELHLFHARGNKRGPHVLTVIKGKRRTAEATPVKPYKHREVPRLWCSLPKLLLFNVTSLNNKLDELHTTVTSISSIIVVITEAWQIPAVAIYIHNYTLFHHLCISKRGRGVVLICQNDLSPSSVNVQVPDELEMLWVRIKPRHHPCHVASIGHPQRFLQHL